MLIAEVNKQIINFIVSVPFFFSIEEKKGIGMGKGNGEKGVAKKKIFRRFSLLSVFNDL